MHPTANLMIQLQELMMARHEQVAAGVQTHLGQLDQSIADFTDKLSGQTKTTFLKLAEKDSNIIVPIIDDFCTSCRMKLPISLVQQVRMAKEMFACPNCARFVYVPDQQARNTRRQPKRFETQAPGIARFSSPNLMIAKLSADSREAVIEELATKLDEEGFVSDAAPLIDHALDRESLFSTAVEHGLAFPHVRGVEGGGLTLAVGLHKKGVKFGAPKGRLSRIFFFMVIPTAASSFYLKLLSGLTETFMSKDARDQMLSSKTDDELWKHLVKLTRKAIQ